jgi:hypothetical protein
MLVVDEIVAPASRTTGIGGYGPGSRSLRSLVRDDTDRVIARRFPPPMTGSAKQSTVGALVTMDCFVALLLAMTVKARYLFDLRFFAAFLFFERFFGTFLPSALASERPIAIACLRLLTLRPDRPLFRVPALRFFIARPTLADAFFEYFRAMIILPVVRK